MAKANYGYEKRQRELAKKRKKEEKRLRKAGTNASDSPDPNAAPEPPAQTESGGDAPERA